jgi:hypothetical protein
MSTKDAPMLDTTLQLDEGRLREDSGRTPETADVSAIYDRSVLLMQAAAVGADAASGARESGWKGDWLVLLQALCKLTVTQASAGDPAPLFTAERLRQEIASLVGDPEAQWWSDESDTARKKFTNAWRALENDIGRIEENLCGRAISSRVAGIVTLSTPTRLGTTNAMGYGLSVSPIALPATAAAEPPPITNAPVGQLPANCPIDYLEEMEAYPIPGLKKPLKISLSGWRAALITLPVVIGLAIAGLLSWFLLALLASDVSPRALLQAAVLTGVIGGLVAWLCHPFYALIHDRIVRAPTFLEARLPLGHVLLIRREGEDRVLRMVRYTATCPVCEGEITIEKGRRRLRGRLIGECGRNPVEHVFSFDFITRKGERL